MRKFKRALSFLLSLTLILSLAQMALVSVNAASYSNGYTGAMAGDGKIYTEGIDVSKWQNGNIDFNSVKNAGYTYVIIKCGSTYGKDSCFDTFYAQAKAAGLNVGTYYYSYATTTAMAETDANNCLSWMAGKTFEYPIYFDYEDPTQNSLDGNLSAQICYAFLNKIKAAGYLPGLYSMAGWLERDWVTTSGLRNDFEGWVARYPNSGSYTDFNHLYINRYGMYQYTAEKYINGKGPYDANVCYKDYPTIVKTYGFNGYEVNSLKNNPTQIKVKDLVFNATFYYNRYEDVRNAFGMDEEKLYDHFLEYGIKEGRCASPYFDVQWYMLKNDQGLIDYCNGDYMKAYEHFLEYIEDENEMNGTPRKLSQVLDINYYKNRYRDLRNTGWTTEYDYLYHFATSGVNEWRQGSAEFDPVCYACFNEDVFNMYSDRPAEIYAQYMSYGVNETHNPARVKTAELMNFGDTFYATISEINTGKVFDLVYDAPNSNYEDNSAIVINTPSDSKTQLWKFQRQADGLYTITNAQYTDKLLDGDSVYLGARIPLSDFEGNCQKWAIYSKDGNCVLKAMSNSTVVMVNNSTDDYTVVMNSIYNGTSAQLFKITKVGEEPEETTTEVTEPVTEAPIVTEPASEPSTEPEEDKYYKVVFLGFNDKFISISMIKAGESAVAPEISDFSEGGYNYSFTGWDTDFSSITADTVIRATFEKSFGSFTVTFTDKDGNELSEQTVEYGKAATAPTAPEVDGYEFTGWSEDFDYVTKDITVKAEYKKIVTPPTPATTGTLKIELSGGSSFTIAINGGVARPQGSTFTSTSVPIGATVTVVANATSDKEFIGWVNPATGFVATTDYEFTFTTSGNDFYKAVFNTKVDGVNMVSFYNDVTKQYLDVQYYAATDEIVWPTVDPVQAGYDFVGWNMTAEEIAAELAAGNDVTVLPEWEKQLVYVTLEVVNGTVTAGEEKDGKYLANTKTTVKANAAADGYKFAYWTLDGKVVTYNEEYSFYPKADAKLEAVFVTEDTTVEYKVLAEVSSFTATQYGQFGISWYVPEAQNNLTYKGAGIVAVKENLYNESTFIHGTTDANVWDRSLNTDKANGSAVWTGPVLSGETWIAACWVQYTDNATGETVVIYSDLFTVTK